MESSSVNTSNILILNKDPEAVKTLTFFLSKPGRTIEGALNGRDAISKIMSNNFDLIVSELMLNEMTGLDVANSLRKQGYRTPIVIFTYNMDLAKKLKKDFENLESVWLLENFKYKELDLIIENLFLKT